jgi:hypothetical protein
MNRSIAMHVRVALAGLLLAVAAANSGCEVYAAGPVGYPSDAYLATADPVYYGGVASYYYGGRWYYRSGGRWGAYGRTPPYLAGYHGRYGGGARSYGRGGGARGRR